MRTEFRFTEGASKELFLTNAAKWTDSLRNGTILEDGRCLETELTEDEKVELENYIMAVLEPEIEIMVKAKKRKANLDYDKAEDLKVILMMKVYEDFYKFNNVEYLTDKEKQYTISTFLEHKTHEAMRELMIEERNLPVNAIRNLKVISDVIYVIASENEVSVDDVSPLMVFDRLEDKSISYKMVLTLMDIYHGTVSIDDMEDADDRLQDNATDVVDKLNLEMDKQTKDALDRIFYSFSKLELYILMKEYGFWGEETRKMTAKELSYKDYFVALAREDQDGEKNIKFGNVHIKRPGRNSGTFDEVFVESVFYVKEKFYSNKVAKIKKKIAELATKVEMKDLEGCLEEYCMELWNERYM